MVFVTGRLFYLLVIVCFSLIVCVVNVSGKVTHCYQCRSRGSLGDCGDPFNWNYTTIGSDRGTKAVEMVPCPSGWCGKTVEGKDDDPIKATERMCLTRKPIDNVERCSDTFYENRKDKLFMCFCRGDLCNNTVSNHPNYMISMVLVIICMYFYIQ